jgi:hypothetical protein
MELEQQPMGPLRFYRLPLIFRLWLIKDPYFRPLHTPLDRSNIYIPLWLFMLSRRPPLIFDHSKVTKTLFDLGAGFFLEYLGAEIKSVPSVCTDPKFR